LSITNDCRLCLRRFYTFRAAVGEFELATILHILHPEDDSEWKQLPIGLYFPEIHDASYGDKFADLVIPDKGMVVVVVEVDVEVGGGVVAGVVAGMVTGGVVIE